LDVRSSPAEFDFVVTYKDEELRAFQKVMAKTYARAQSEGTGFGILLGVIFVLGLAAFGAFRLGVIDPSAVQSIVFTAYFAFLTGVAGYYFVMRTYFRKFLRTDQRGGTWHYFFTPAGICYRSETIEVRLAWRAVNAVEDLGKAIVLRFGIQGLTVPGFLATTPRALLSLRPRALGSKRRLKKPKAGAEKQISAAKVRSGY
jgi:hypothetical protein